MKGKNKRIKFNKHYGFGNGDKSVNFHLIPFIHFWYYNDIENIKSLSVDCGIFLWSITITIYIKQTSNKSLIK